MKLRHFAFLAFLLPVGCATLPEPHPPAGPDARDCHRWHLSGRIGVIRGEEGWHGGFDWHQIGERYRISLRGPLGQGGLLVIGDAGRARLVPARGAPLEGRDIDRLVARALGWPVPVTGLGYWVRGRLAPGRDGRILKDARGLPERILQDGWVIDFSAWTEDATGHPWPTRIRAVRDGLKLRVVLKQPVCEENRPASGNDA